MRFPPPHRTLLLVAKLQTIAVAVSLLVAATLLTTRCEALEYSLGALSLLSTLSGSSGESYTCVPTAAFERAASCVPRGGGPTKDSEANNVVIDKWTSSILYAYEMHMADGPISRVEQDILQQARNSSARIYSVDKNIVLIWGDVRLEAVSPNADEYDQYDAHSGKFDRALGLLISTAGDFKATKAAHRPVYRVVGGDGLLIILHGRGQKQVLMQRMIVAAGMLSERNFRSQARTILDAEDKTGDLSKWYDMAYAVRRLALNTNEMNANRALDDFYRTSINHKYESHIWAFLPLSVIKHLHEGRYMALDIFGEHTEFPEIREGIVAQLRAEPSAPFSEFLLYSIGRFDQALEIGQASPIKTILIYASAHAKFRNVAALLFERVANTADHELIAAATYHRSYLEDLNPENLQFIQHPDLMLRFRKAIRDGDEQADRDETKYDETDAQTNKRLSEQDFFHGHAYETIANKNDFYRDAKPCLTQYLNYLNEFPSVTTRAPLLISFPISSLLRRAYNISSTRY